MHLPLSYRLYRSLWTCLDWLYPPTCGGCGTQGLRWCVACQAAVEPLAPPLCQHCGQPLTSPGLCRECRESPPAFKVARSWAAFDGPVRSALHRLKYRRDLGLGEVLALPLVGLAARQSWAIDLVVPVPLGLARLRERGYNQSAAIARPLALGLRVPYRPQALSKIRDTRTQVNLNVRERKKNVAGAFKAHPAIVTGQSVLLVDDVATSGATLDACAAALLAAGASEVYAVTVARAAHGSDSGPPRR